MTVHGGNIYDYQENITDFSANINPLGMPDSLRQAIITAIDEAVHYPDHYCRKLRALLAEQLDCEAAEIVCGNGAADLIFRAVGALKPQKALLIAPAFSEYEAALKQNGVEIVYYDLEETKDFRLQEDFLFFLADIRPDMVFLCNPHNPSGNVVKKNFMWQIAVECQKIDSMLIIDECFYDFWLDGENQSLLSSRENFDHMLILRAFTKMYAMAGVRLGYLVSANRSLVAQIAETGQWWSVSHLAQAAGCAAVKEKTFAMQSRLLIAEERDKMIKTLKNLGCKVYPSQANYLLFRHDDPLLKQKLLAQQILIRSCQDYRGLNEHYYRIAIKLPEENQQLLVAMERVLGKDSAQWER